MSHDARGTAIWNWDVATSVLAASKSGDLLQMLENPTLELEAGCAQSPDWSGDPYNRRWRKRESATSGSLIEAARASR